MSITFITRTTTFTNQTGAPFKRTESVTFSSTVTSASVVISGYDVGFDNCDGRFQHSQVTLSDVNIQGSTVTYLVTVGLKDNSGIYDDPFYGTINATIIADISKS